MSKLLTRDLLDKITIFLGGLFLVLLVIGSWVPSDCPVVRKAIIGCPTVHVSTPPTEEQKELDRIGHQNIQSNQQFFRAALESDMAKAEKTRVRFFYRLEDATRQSVLQLKTNNGFENVALISHPILTSLTWSALKEDNLQLFQNDTAHEFKSLSELKRNPPLPDQLIADKAAAQKLGLRRDQYTALEELTILPADATHVLTSAPAAQKDGSWDLFDGVIFTENAALTEARELEWSILTSPAPSIEKPAYLSTVHIDFHRL